MLNSMKSSASEKDKNAAANVTEVMGRTVQPHDQAWARSGPTTKEASCIGSDMSIVGKIECNGPAQVFGRNRRRVAGLGSFDRRWHKDRRHCSCAERHGLRPREGTWAAVSNLR
jgi:hypothetical protein